MPGLARQDTLLLLQGPLGRRSSSNQNSGDTVILSRKSSGCGHAASMKAARKASSLRSVASGVAALSKQGSKTGSKRKLGESSVAPTLSKQGSQAGSKRKTGVTLGRKRSVHVRKQGHKWRLDEIPKQKGSVRAVLSKKGSAAGSKRKLADNLSQKGRKRHKPNRFEPKEELKKSPKKSPGKKKNKKQKDLILYEKGVILAVLNSDGGYWLASPVEPVREGRTTFRAKWLELSGNEYKDSYKHFSAGYNDTILLDSVITEVTVKRGARVIYLSKREQARILKKIDGEDSDDEEEADDDEDVAEKKGKKSPKSGKKAAVKKPKLTDGEKRDPNRRLKPHPSVSVPNQNPFFFTNDKIPFISVTSHTKLVSRAVLMNDLTLLKKLIHSDKNIATVDLSPCLNVPEGPVKFAIKAQNKKALDLLLRDLFKKNGKPRCSLTRSLLGSQGTGRYNHRSLGVPAIRALCMSRGAREGNNALTKDLDVYTGCPGMTDFISYALELGVGKDVIDNMMISADHSNQKQFVYSQIWKAVRFGHRKLAGQLMKEQEEKGMSSFNFLHKEVLLFDNEDLRKLRLPSVKKKPYDNHGILPIHCAAINPNPKYLSKLLNILPEYGIPDSSHRRPIHYSAACTSTAPMQLLIKRGQNPDEPDGSGMTCLHIACETGRFDTIKFLLSRSQADSQKKNKEADDEEEEEEEEEDEEDEDRSREEMEKKFGVGGVNRPVLKPQNKEWFSYCPLHIAVQKNHLDCVDVLLEFGADVKKELGATQNKRSPLMIAAVFGDLDMVQLLVSKGAAVEQKDKLKRTALLHACMNGQTHIAAYFLSLGANPNQADSSGNTCIHYAAAYGWYHCVKLLLSCGADPNAANDWKVTPVGIAFLKGHMGLIDVLLEQPSVDINFRDDQGMTLVGIACATPLDRSICDQIKYLVEDKNADCTLSDVNKSTPLHHVAKSDIRQSYQAESIAEASESSVKIAEILLNHGCDPSQKDSEGMTALMYAVQKCNQSLIQLLVDRGCSVSDAVDSLNRNILHLLANRCMDEDLASILNLIAKSVDSDQMKLMCAQVDDNGFTPLLTACKAYAEWNGQKNTDKVVNNRDESGSEDDSMDESDEEDESNYDDEDDEDYDDEDDEDDYPRRKRAPKKAATPAPPVTPAAPAAVDESTPAAKQWKASRDFITFLITKCGADVNAQVQEKRYKAGCKVPEEEDMRYVGEYGKFSPLFFMVNVGSETGVKTRTQAIDSCPGLSCILKQKPDLTLKNLEKRSAFIHAIVNKRVHVATKLIQAGVDPNSTSGNEKTDGLAPSVVLAAKFGLEDVLFALMAKKASLFGVDCNNGRTAFHYAVLHSKNSHWRNSFTLLKSMLGAGSSVNCTDKSARTPLHIAVNANLGGADASSEIEQFLLDAGADVHALDIRKRMPIHYAFVKIGEHTDTSVIDPIDLCSTLSSNMNEEFLANADEFGQTVLHRAAIRGAGVCCMHLIQKKVGIDLKDNNGNTALALAVNAGHESCTILLLQRNALVSNEIHTPPPSIPEELDEDKEKKKQKKSRWLPVVMKSDVILTTKTKPIFQKVVEREWQGVLFIMLDMRGDFPFSFAVKAALDAYKFNLTLTLIRKLKDRKELSVVTQHNRSLFHVIARNSNTTNAGLQLRVVRQLLDSRVPTDELDAFGASPLHYACLNCNDSLAEFFIKNCNIDVNAEDNQGRTALATILWNEESNSHAQMQSMFALLTKNGASLQTRCKYSLRSVLFPSQGVPDYEEAADASVSVSPLIKSIYSADSSLMESLVKNFSADINYPDSDGVTPVMHAVRMNKLHSVCFLMNHSVHFEEFNRRVKEATEVKKQSKSKKDAGAQNAPFLTFGRLARKQSTVQELTDPSLGYKQDLNIDLLKVRLTSDLDLKAQDNQGWSVLHHLVNPLEHGCFENVQLLKMLVDAGADLSAKDRSGMTALDHAVKKGAATLVDAMQVLMKIPQVAVERRAFEVNDGMNWADPVPDYKRDASAMLERHLAAVAEEENDDGTTRVPDQKLNMRDTGEVVFEEASQEYFDVLLTKIDVKAGDWGLYNFYKMQLVRHKGKNMYVLFTCWGRIGDEGQFQQTPFPDVNAAKKEFCKIFKAKTGNEFSELKSFENKDKKYRLVDVEKRRPSGKKVRNLSFDLKSTIPSKLPQYVQDMLKEITDVTAMNKAIHDIGVDEELMPLGRIKKENIEKAFEFLKELLVLVKSISKRREDTPIKDLDGYHKELTEISNLTSEYYHLIPQGGFAFEQILPLDTEDRVGREWKHLTSLLELEVASKILAGAQYRCDERNPLDYVYQSIGTKIELMKENETETECLLSYINKSMDIARSCKVTGIFRVERPGEDDRLRDCGVDNRRLLFHGSSTSNLMSILKRGLLIAPPEAPACGYLFGKGIYTADQFAKSAAYCYNWGFGSGNSKHKFMLVCEVALGRVNQLLQPEYMEKAKTGTDSCQYVGARGPNPAFNLTLPTGVAVPIGEIQDQGKLFSRTYLNVQSNEYIVYKPEQVALRYIIQFK